MGLMGLRLIERVCCLILFSRVVGLILEVEVENGTLGSLASWVELAEPLGGSLKVPISPLISC